MKLQDQIVELISRHLDANKILGEHWLRLVNPSPDGDCIRFIVEDRDGEPTENEVVVAVITFGKD